MEIIKREISLETFTDRTSTLSYGALNTTGFIYINVPLLQDVDDMGMFTDLSFIPKNNTIPDYTVLINKLNLSGITFPFMAGITPAMDSVSNLNTYPYVRYSGAVASDWYRIAGIITGNTNDRLNEVSSYNQNDLYIPNFNIDTDQYINYLGVSVNGVTRVVNDNDPIVYAFDAPVFGIGTNAQINGLQYKSYSATTYDIIDGDGDITTLPLTTVRYLGEGFNNTNVGLSALTKEEYLLGIISQPEIQSDVFIDRGVTTVMENHLRLGEIKSLFGLLDYGNGYYNVKV